MGGARSPHIVSIAVSFPHSVMSSPAYVTSDVYLAAFFLSQGLGLISCERVSARRNEFRFASSEKLHELLRLYWRRDALPLVPFHLFESLRKLKSIARQRPVTRVINSDDVVTPQQTNEGESSLPQLDRASF